MMFGPTGSPPTRRRRARFCSSASAKTPRMRNPVWGSAAPAGRRRASKPASLTARMMFSETAWTSALACSAGVSSVDVSEESELREADDPEVEAADPVLGTPEGERETLPLLEGGEVRGGGLGAGLR